jgi:Flp pilus assembly protein TadG
MKGTAMRSTRLSRPRNLGEHGNITVEMALAIPVFLLLVAGVFDLGMLFWEKHPEIISFAEIIELAPSDSR